VNLRATETRPIQAEPTGAMARLDALAAFTDEPGRLTRLFLTPSHKAAAEQVAAWMREAGMAVEIDAAANVVGRYAGTDPAAPAMLLGSHIDTVRKAGRYDGTLGVVVAIEAVAALHRRGERLANPIEVLAFGDEEGVRFPVTLTGSRAVAGAFDPADLAAADGEGVTVRDALAAFGCDPARVGSCARRPADVLAYVEVHIEQGPVLEREGLPLGIVTAINGASRYRVAVYGATGHAGTVPMALRRDALAAAAEMMLAIEARAREEADLVATVGEIAAGPGAVNVIPGAVTFSLDLRAPDDAQRRRAGADILVAIETIAARRGVGVEIVRTHEAAAVACDPDLIARLAAAVEACGMRVRLLPSGAGHDAMAIAALCPVGMLFVRCTGGISHNPTESIRPEDADAAIRVLVAFLTNLSGRTLPR
jgi:allantoate deiminase